MEDPTVTQLLVPTCILSRRLTTVQRWKMSQMLAKHQVVTNIQEKGEKFLMFLVLDVTFLIINYKHVFSDYRSLSKEKSRSHRSSHENSSRVHGRNRHSPATRKKSEKHIRSSPKRFVYPWGTIYR